MLHQLKLKRYAHSINKPLPSFLSSGLPLLNTRKQEWIKTLRMTINEWNNKRATLLNVNVSDPAFMVEAPVWIPDDEVMGCMLCRTVFSITKRRVCKLLIPLPLTFPDWVGFMQHHCRSCGKVICNDCSRKKMLLVNVDVSAPVRVCDFCYNKLSGPPPSPRPQEKEGSISEDEERRRETNYYAKEKVEPTEKQMVMCGVVCVCERERAEQSRERERGERERIDNGDRLSRPWQGCAMSSGGPQRSPTLCFCTPLHQCFWCV